MSEKPETEATLSPEETERVRTALLGLVDQIDIGALASTRPSRGDVVICNSKCA